MNCGVGFAMFLIASFASIVLGLLLTVTAVFLILLILVQRGRGGGLTGALGGMGGQSAFGAKAGDVFTRITIGTAAVWIVLCVAAVKILGTSSDRLDLGPVNPAEGGSRAAAVSGAAPEEPDGPPASGPAAPAPDLGTGQPPVTDAESSNPQ